jgi:hypothetical protein
VILIASAGAPVTDLSSIPIGAFAAEVVDAHFTLIGDGNTHWATTMKNLPGIDDSGSIFGRTDLAAIAKGFGLRGASVTDTGQFGSLFDAYRAQDTAEV